MTTQINSTSELQAINTMLSFIGESPVSSITGNIGTDVAVAKNILDETSMSVQSQGWIFNRELDTTASRDTSNKVPLEANCVQIEASAPYQYFYQYTIRNQYLYDLKNKTDIFTYDPKVDKVLVQQFEQLPEYARQYITQKASRRFASRFLGDAQIVQLIGQDENEALMAFHQADSQETDVNMLEGDSNTYSIINRPTRRTY